MVKRNRQKKFTNIKPLNKISLQSKFWDTIKILPNLSLIDEERNIKYAKYDEMTYNKIMKLVPLEELNTEYKLDARNGNKNLDKYPFIAAYDESINKFTALQGIAYLFSHTLVYLYQSEYIPMSLLAFYFFTKAGRYKSENNDGIIVTDDIPTTSKEIYVRDKVEFLKENVYKNTILFIDGPLIGGDWYVSVITAIYHYFTPNNIIPIFFVKNSQSSIIIDNIPKMRMTYNSDMHWAYYELKKGYRSPFFKYMDPNNPRNARIFCYIKAFDASPIRVEFHPITYQKYKNLIQDILDMIYYFLLVQGDAKNPQIRPIAIAEKYAREILHLFDLEKIMKSSKLIPAINQERFGWSS